jgi:hypothetical protein
MRKGTKRLGGAAVGLLGLLVVFGTAVALLKGERSKAPSRASEDQPDEVTERWRGFTDAPPGVAVDPAPPPPGDGGPAAAEGNGWLAPTISREQMDLAVEAWRQGILDRNAETVMTMDRIFTQLPGRYGPQLERVAQDDADERVRAFSTRVLGKTKNVGLAGLFRRLLTDKSPFVRQNAAWALGELLSVPKGRAALESATAELRQVETSDPAPDVRAAATNTLKKLQ